ncbi:gamma subclass chorismate mutase AroQ [Variovorax paradoxus]|nr:gamma subclass chorismate mutase AroQ [Variovorax paradoxus]
MAIGLVWLACASALAQPNPSPEFSALVALSATRLDISRRVALTKWDTTQQVADPPGDPREKEVIAAAASEASARGLSGDMATAFFSDQIEASKLVQFALIASWWRAGRVSAEPRADLKGELRPALDKLQSVFIDELIATHTLRADADCRKRLANATAVHVEVHRLTPLFALALDRGLARVCGD